MGTDSLAHANSTNTRWSGFAIVSIVLGAHFTLVYWLTKLEVSSYPTAAFYTGTFLIALGAMLLAWWLRSVTDSQPLRSALLAVSAVVVLSYVVGAVYTWGLSEPTRASARGVMAMLLGVEASCLILYALLASALTKWGNSSKPILSDAWLLMLPAFPLVNYLAANSDYYDIERALTYFITFLGVPALVIVAVTALLGPLCRVRLVPPLVASCAFTTYVMPMITSMTDARTKPSFLIHFTVLILVSAVVSRAYQKSKGRLYTFVTLLSVSAGILGIVNSNEAGTPTASQDERRATLAEALQKVPAKKPDIFFLVYDGYANEKMMSRYGIDISQQVDFLRQKGFSIYPNAYTIAVWSRASIRRLLDMDYSPQQYIGGPNLVYKTLKKWGYRTYLAGLDLYLRANSPFGPEQTIPKTITPIGANSISSGILLGYFDEAKIFKREGMSHPRWKSDKQAVILSRTSETPPLFMYAHSLATHHFTNANRRCAGNEAELYGKQVAMANQEMREDIEAILSSSRDAIIVVAGDHGPDVLSCGGHAEGLVPTDQIRGVDLADLFGCFLAIRVPDQAFAEYDKISILQDVFFSFFAYLQRDPNILNYRMTPDVVGKSQRNVPAGGISNGMITIGPDQGKKLFESF